MDAFKTELRPGAIEGEWWLRLTTPDGLMLDYRCKSHQRARFMAAIFALGPTTLPPADRIHYSAAPAPAPAPVRRKRTTSAKRGKAVVVDEIDVALAEFGG